MQENAWKYKEVKRITNETIENIENHCLWLLCHKPFARLTVDDELTLTPLTADHDDSLASTPEQDDALTLTAVQDEPLTLTLSMMTSFTLTTEQDDVLTSTAERDHALTLILTL